MEWKCGKKAFRCSNICVSCTTSEFWINNDEEHIFAYRRIHTKINMICMERKRLRPWTVSCDMRNAKCLIRFQIWFCGENNHICLNIILLRGIAALQCSNHSPFFRALQCVCVCALYTIHTHKTMAVKKLVHTWNCRRCHRTFHKSCILNFGRRLSS